MVAVTHIWTPQPELILMNAKQMLYADTAKKISLKFSLNTEESSQPVLTGVLPE